MSRTFVKETDDSAPLPEQPVPPSSLLPTRRGVAG